MPRPTLLNDFVSIKTDSDVLDFAQRWGVLQICWLHGIPSCNAIGCAPCELAELGDSWRFEQVEEWHGLVRKANAIRLIGESILNGGKGSQSNWLSLIDMTMTRPEAGDSATREALAQLGLDHFGEPWKSKAAARLRLTLELNIWLEFSKSQPLLGWERDRWAIRNRSSGLFGYLAVSLAQAVVSGMDSAICTFCGAEYWPLRRPTPGQRNRCDREECKKAYWREHKQRKPGPKGEMENA